MLYKAKIEIKTSAYSTMTTSVVTTVFADSFAEAETSVKEQWSKYASFSIKSIDVIGEPVLAKTSRPLTAEDRMFE